jgi:RNA ligase (TIGR02306 family)
MRKMARIVKIDNVIKHPNADALDICFIGGWQVVTKTGEFQAGQLAVFCEVDSWVPTEIAPFLTRAGHGPKKFNGVKGERLKTIKLRGELSQGLLLPFLGSLAEKIGAPSDGREWTPEGIDVSEILGIQKYEAPEKGISLGGDPKGNFPSEFPKTDQERLQNLSRRLAQWIETGEEFEVTEKAEGSSQTCYLMRDGTFGVCSRKLDLKRDENNTYWKTAIKYNIEQKMKDFFGEFPEYSVALQGELIGPKIEGNIYKLQDHEFRVFDIVYEGGRYMDSINRAMAVGEMGLQHTPWVATNFKLLPMQEMLDFADGKSLLNSQTNREGLVFKSLTNPQNSFKVVSNAYLLKNN